MDETFVQKLHRLCEYHDLNKAAILEEKKNRAREVLPQIIDSIKTSCVHDAIFHRRQTYYEVIRESDLDLIIDELLSELRKLGLKARVLWFGKHSIRYKTIKIKW